jgi:hypothetical protein
VAVAAATPILAWRLQAQLIRLSTLQAQPSGAETIVRTSVVWVDIQSIPYLALRCSLAVAAVQATKTAHQAAVAVPVAAS